MNRITILAIAFSAVLLLFLLEMVRRRRLREEYSILWLIGSIAIMVLATARPWLETISLAVGIAYPPSFLFLVGILFIILILIHFSIAISKLYRMNTRIAQEIALLRLELRQSPPGGFRSPEEEG